VERNVVSLHEVIARHVEQLLEERPRVLLAVDGPDAAGKTTLADVFAAELPAPVIRASIDGFHNPRRIRMRQGEWSGEGYYQDSFDYSALHARLLAPFAGGEPAVATQVFDHRQDAPAECAPTAVPARAVLVLDGVFLLRPQLRDRWDLSIYLDVGPEITLSRAVIRDLALFGSAEAVQRRYLRRYLPGQALYQSEASPRETADFLVDNTDPGNPRILRFRGVSSS
jgi:uridine kinase